MDISLLLLLLFTTTGGHSQGLTVRIETYPISAPYPAAKWIHFACHVTGNTSMVIYNWTLLCGSQDPPLVTNTYVNHNKVGQYDIQIRSTPSYCQDTVMCSASDTYGSTGQATWRVGRVSGAGFWGTSNFLLNMSALRASVSGDIGTIYCHSSTTNSNVGRWVSPQGLNITWNFTDPFSIQFNNGPGYPSFNTLQLHNPTIQPFTSTYEGIYSCVVPNDQGIMLKLHIGIYSNQYSSVLELQLAQLGRLSESPLTLNCPTTGLPPTHIIWAKGTDYLANGATYGITTVLRDRQNSTFDNLLQINQTLEQSEGFYFFQVGNDIDSPIQDRFVGAQRTIVYLFIAMYLVGGSTSINCFIDGAYLFTWFDQEANPVVTGRDLSVSFNDSIHDEFFTCIGANSTAVVGFERIKFIFNVPADTLHVSAQSDDSAPVLGQSYSMDCVGHKTRSGLMSMPSPQWFLPNGTVLSSGGNVQLQGPRHVRLSSELVAQFSILRTSHAGTYTCQASLSSPALTSPIVKNVSFGITVKIPTPTVTLTMLSSEPHVVGGTFSLQCEATVSHHVNTPISVNFTWRRTSGLLAGSSDSRVTISQAMAVGDLTYRSVLTINDLRIAADSNMNYDCQAVVRSDPPSQVIITSTSASSNAQILNVLAIGVSVSVTPDQITVIDVPPFNSFTLTCAATAASNTSATMVFTWLKQTPGSESSTNVIHNGHSVVIVTSGDTSTLVISETQSGGYVYNCSVRIGDAEGSSDTAVVSVRGRSVPVATTNLESAVTSFSTARVSWTVPRVAYTPETYTVVYGTNQLNLDQRSDSVNGTSGTTHYSVELTQLQHSTHYYYQVESVNTAGRIYSEIIGSFEVPNASVIISITSSDSFPAAGNNFTLICSVAELVDYSGETVVTWIAPEGQNISSGDFVIIRKDVSQRVDYNLQFNPLRVSHGGQYVCQVSIPNIGFYGSKSISIQATPGILEVTIQSTGTSQVGTPYHLACQIGNGLTPSIGPVVYEWTSTCSGECFILRQPGIATASTQYLKAVDSGTHTCTVTDSVGNQGSASVNVSTTGVGIYYSSNGLISNNSVVMASNGVLQGSFFCLSGKVEAGIGRWIAPNGQDFTTSGTHAFEVTVGGERNPGVVKISLSSSESHFPAGNWDGIYSCVIPDETGAEQIIYLGVYLVFGSSPNVQPVIQSLTASSLGLYSHFTLNCSSGVSAATEVTWTKDSQSLNIDNRVYSSFQILREGTSSSYDNLLVVAISDVNEHSGQYGCTVRNSFGSSTQSATFLGIRVSEHGIFSLGSEVSVTCSSDFGVTSIDWLQGGQVISTNQSSEGRLQIQSVMESDHSSQYTCVATAPFGVQEHSITIQVEVDPDSVLTVNVTKSASQPNEGSDFRLICMARKSLHLQSTPTIDWYDSMGNRIVTGEGIRLGLLVESGDGTVVRSLTFVSLDPSHTMEYRCNATIRFLPPPYIISKEAVWNLVVQNRSLTLPPTSETDQSSQQSTSVYIGAGIGVGAAIVFLFLLLVVVTILLWRRYQKLKRIQLQANVILDNNINAMSLEITQNLGYTPVQGAGFGSLGVTDEMILPHSHDGPKLPPRNDPNFNQNVYERCDSYNCINDGTMNFIAQPPPPLYEPHLSSKSDKGYGLYAEIILMDDNPPQDECVSTTDVKFQLLPEDEKKGKEDIPKEPDAAVKEGDV